MIWLTWRQFRTQALVVLALLAALALYLLITGTQLRHAYNADLTACRSQNDCFGTLNGLQDQYNGELDLVGLLVMAAPALIGVFWGAPLIAGELERGTHYLAWNQSVTRTRWFAVKLTGVALASLLTAGLFSLLVTWWASPLDTVATGSGSRFGTEAFNGRNIVPLGYAAFAFALGVLLGLLIRRTLPAMAATLAIFLAIQVLVTAEVRPHLLPATTTTVAINQSSMNEAIRFDPADPSTGYVTTSLPAPPGAWILSETPMLDNAGRPIHTPEIQDCFERTLSEAGAGGKGSSSGFGAFGACVAPDDLHVEITYQPAGRYWQLQWIETFLYAVLAAVLTAVSFRRIRRLRG